MRRHCHLSQHKFCSAYAIQLMAMDLAWMQSFRLNVLVDALRSVAYVISCKHNTLAALLLYLLFECFMHIVMCACVSTEMQGTNALWTTKYAPLHTKSGLSQSKVVSLQVSLGSLTASFRGEWWPHCRVSGPEPRSPSCLTHAERMSTRQKSAKVTNRFGLSLSRELLGRCHRVTQLHSL